MQAQVTSLDVIVHRLLGAAIGVGTTANAPWCDKMKMKELTEGIT
jgi:hypothetical protein